MNKNFTKMQRKIKLDEGEKGYSRGSFVGY